MDGLSKIDRWAIVSGDNTGDVVRPSALILPCFLDQDLLANAEHWAAKFLVFSCPRRHVLCSHGCAGARWGSLESASSQCDARTMCVCSTTGWVSVALAYGFMAKGETSLGEYLLLGERSIKYSLGIAASPSSPHTKPHPVFSFLLLFCSTFSELWFGPSTR